MKKYALALPCLTILTALCITMTAMVAQPTREARATQLSSTFDVDTVHSSVIFRIKHLGVSYTYGRFDAIEGSYVLNPDNPGASHLSFSVPTAGVNTNSEGRDKHLRSSDFFNVEQHPSIAFNSTKVTSTGQDKYAVTGDLTLLGVTKSITIDLDFVGEVGDSKFGHKSGFETVFTIKRSDFGMNHMVGPIGDEVRLIVSIEGNAKVES